jgi:hypothetical protein
MHSIAAKYAVRPAARFIHPSTRDRRRRLGLSVTGSFQAAAVRATVLRRSEGPLVQLRASWREASPVQPERSSVLSLRAHATMHWPRSGRPGGSRAGASSAPWRA